MVTSIVPKWRLRQRPLFVIFTLIFLSLASILFVIKKVRTKSIKKPFNPALVESSLFEEQKKKFIKIGRNYLRKKEAGFRYDIEYDPATRYQFIHLDGKQGKIGKGKFKVVTKSILYNTISTEVVARAVQLNPNTRELEIVNLLKGARGIVEIRSMTAHERKGKKYHAIFSKLYNPGSLRKVFDTHAVFTLFEKMQIALNILYGLEAMHNQNIVHRDLGSRNYLIDISPGAPGERNVVAVISDLGRAIAVSQAANTKAQGNTSYTAPEALYMNRMKDTDYFAADVYAVGCVLYQLLHEKTAPWQKSYIKIEKNIDIAYQQLIDTIAQNSFERFAQLSSKKEAKTITLEESFEYLILRMCRINPAERGTASLLREEMKLLCNEVS